MEELLLLNPWESEKKGIDVYITLTQNAKPVFSYKEHYNIVIL